jgi:hypothetical protein
MIKVVQYIVYSKQKAKNPGFYGIFSGVRINLLPPTITELHKILITCIHLNDNIISYPPNPIFYILIVVHKLQDLSNNENIWKSGKIIERM